MPKPVRQTASPELVGLWVNRYLRLAALIKQHPDHASQQTWQMQRRIFVYLIHRYGGEAGPNLNRQHDLKSDAATDTKRPTDNVPGEAAREGGHDLSDIDLPASSEPQEAPPRPAGKFASRLQRLQRMNSDRYDTIEQENAAQREADREFREAIARDIHERHAALERERRAHAADTAKQRAVEARQQMKERTREEGMRRAREYHRTAIDLDDDDLKFSIDELMESPLGGELTKELRKIVATERIELRRIMRGGAPVEKDDTLTEQEIVDILLGDGDAAPPSAS